MKTIVLDRLNFSKKWKTPAYGLIIGTIHENEFHLFLPIECPENVSSEKINPKWVGQHASNVFRMLSGGTTVLGFFIADADNSNDNNLIQQVLSQIYTKEKNMNYELFSTENPNKIFLKIDLKNSKLQCSKISLDDSKGTLKNIDIKYTDLIAKYSILQSNISIRIDTIMPNEKDKELILKHLKDAVNPFIQEFVTSSILLVNGQQVCGTTELRQFSKVNVHGDVEPAKSGDVVPCYPANAYDEMDLTFVGVNMQPCVDSSIESSSDTDAEFEMINRLKIIGRIPGIAFVSDSSTIADIEDALKRDLTRSIYSRLELLTEELHITGGQMEVAQILLPQRVRLCLPNSRGLPLSDYKFFSETSDDVITRVRYLCRPLGTTDDELDAGCIDSSLEKSEQASLDDELSEVDIPEEMELSNVASKQTSGIIYFVSLSAIVFLISVLAYYLMS